MRKKVLRATFSACSVGLGASEEKKLLTTLLEGGMRAWSSCVLFRKLAISKRGLSISGLWFGSVEFFEMSKKIIFM